ncbi:hypothetical protein [Argonema antarcticum]|uniref:hypothetical protein n=1 Tax=Argonema antarcticum TaxID=2942763 RepID=UPI002010ED91|nr:hypothetical protein [Argonema antarcticum]MCL1474998.1 hypothetical protein [Argonema antarcticum A004/B2]
MRNAIALFILKKAIGYGTLANRTFSPDPIAQILFPTYLSGKAPYFYAESPKLYKCLQKVSPKSTIARLPKLFQN